MMRSRPTQTAHAAALLAWFEDAHTAVDMGHALSVDHALALAATPATAPHRLDTHRTTPRTWFLEEYERVMRQQLREPVPIAGSLADVAAWRADQSRRSDDLAQLVADHAGCLTRALAFVAAAPRPARRARPTTITSAPRRLSAAVVALSTLHHERAA